MGSGRLCKYCKTWQESEMGDEFWLGLCEDDPIRVWGFGKILTAYIAGQ